MNERRLSAALEAALSAIGRGEDVDFWLSRHPDPRLRAMLEAADAARALPVGDVSTPTLQRTRTRILAHAALLRAERPQPRGAGWLARNAIAVVAIGSVLFFSAGGLVAASAGTIPGDNLYPLKRAVEGLSLSLVPHRLRLDLASSYQQRRMEEFHTLISLGESELAAEVIREVQTYEEGTPTEAGDELSEDAGPESTPESAMAVPSPEDAPSSTPDPALTPTTTPTALGFETPTPTTAPTMLAAGSCELITIDDSDYGIVEVHVEDNGEKYEYEGGGRIRYHVSNDNEVPAYLTDSTLDWNAGYAPPMYLDYFKFKGERYFRTDSTSSPSAASAPSIELEGSKWWEAVFNLKGQPFTGTFTLTLTFTFTVEGLEDCTVTAQTQIP
jgi:hypothetical protein